MVKISRSPTPLSRVRVAALIFGAVGAAIAASSVPVSAQVQAYRETPAAALDRNIRLLAKSPKDFLALIAAGKAALALGDAHAAVGFFGRADEVHPASPLPHIGMGAASVADGDAQTALRYFARAQQLGANAAMMGAERGLAYDLIGRHSEAQGDYRAAMFGSDADEARRRLALSQAITGDKAGALATLAPLISRYDAGATRSRAFVLALSGDLEGARRTLDAAMPGSSVRMAPFLVKLPTLRSDQKAAAVNLGIFPATGGSAYAYVPQPSAGPAPAPAQPAPLRTTQAMPQSVPQPAARSEPSRSQPSSSIAATIPMSGDRLATIDNLLKPPGGTSASPPAAPPTQMASITPGVRRQATNAPRAGEVRPRIWVQLASGPNAAALPDQFRRLKTRHRDLLDGISGYVAEGPDRARLLIGPFKDKADANIFVEDLESSSVTAFSWTSTPGDQIRKLPAE